MRTEKIYAYLYVYCEGGRVRLYIDVFCIRIMWRVYSILYVVEVRRRRRVLKTYRKRGSCNSWMFYVVRFREMIRYVFTGSHTGCSHVIAQKDTHCHIRNHLKLNSNIKTKLNSY